MPQLTIDLGLLGLPVTDGDGWVQAVDSLGNPIPIAATNAGTLVFGSRALDFNTSGVATITLPSTDDLEPTGVRYLVFITRTDTITRPVAVGPFVFTADASLDAVAELPPADLVAAFNAVVAAAQDVLDAIGPIEPVAAQVSGYTDHGDISGTVTFTGPTGSHWFTATGPTTITLDGYTEPDVVTLICFGGAADVDVAGLPEVELVDGTAWTAQLARGVWVSGGGSSEPATPDTTPPTAIADLEVTGGEGQVVATWTPAADAESTVRYRARVYLDGTTPPAWPTSGSLYGLTSPTFTATGLAAGNYRVQVHAYSSGGESDAAVSSAVAVTVPLATLLLDTFTRPNGALVTTQPAPDVGPNWTAWSGSIVGSAQIVTNRLAPNATVCASPVTSPPIEITMDVTHGTDPGYVEFGGYGPDFCKAKVKRNGQVEINGSGGTTAIYNASDGTNVYTPTGYITATSYAVRLTYVSGVATLYIDGVKILEVPYSGTPTVNSVFVSVDSGYAGTYVDNIEAKG